MMAPVSGAPTWTILIPTLGERRDSFARLLDVLLPQVEPYGERVRVLAYWNNGRPRLPEIRQRMVEAAQTDYLCCIDDDDLVPGYYAAEVMMALDQRPDYIGFQVQCYENGQPTAISYHDLRNMGWRNDAAAYYRDFSHVNPIRTELARLVSFRKTRPGWPEDRAWVEQLRRLPREWNQVLIDKVMYHYFFSTSRTAGIGSRWRRPNLIQTAGFQPLEVDHPQFSYYPGSVPSG